MTGRIGKVRMKATGFEFRVIPGVSEPDSDVGVHMMRCARDIGTSKGLAGHIVIGVTEDGGFRCGFRWDDSRSPVPRTLIPAYVAEILRRELIVGPETEDTFHRNFEWVE